MTLARLCVLAILFVAMLPNTFGLSNPSDPGMSSRVQKCVDEIRADLANPSIDKNEGWYQFNQEGYEYCIWLACIYSDTPCEDNTDTTQEVYACLDATIALRDDCRKTAPSYASIRAGTVTLPKAEEKECRQVTDTLAKYGGQDYRSDCLDSTTLRTYVCVDANSEPLAKEIYCPSIEYAPGNFYRGCSHPENVVADCSIDAQDRTLQELQQQLGDTKNSESFRAEVYKLTPAEFDLIQAHKSELGALYDRIMAAQYDIAGFQKAIKAAGPNVVADYVENYQGELALWQIYALQDARAAKAKEIDIKQQDAQLRRDRAVLQAEYDAREAYFNSWQYTYDKTAVVSSAIAQSLWDQATWNTVYEQGGFANVMNSNLPFHEKISAVLGPLAFTPLGDAASLTTLPSLIGDPSISNDGKLLAIALAVLPGALDIPEVPYVSATATTILGEVPTTLEIEEFK